MSVGPRRHLAVLSLALRGAPFALQVVDTERDGAAGLEVEIADPTTAREFAGFSRWGMAWCAAGDTFVLNVRGHEGQGCTRAWRWQAGTYTEQAIAQVPGDVVALSDDGAQLAAARSSMTGARREGVVCHPVELLARRSGSRRDVGGLYNPATLTFSPDARWLLGIGFGVPADGKFNGRGRLEARPLARLMSTDAAGQAGCHTARPAACINFEQRAVAGIFAADSRSVWLAGRRGSVAQFDLRGGPLQRFDHPVNLLFGAFALGGSSAALLRAGPAEGLATLSLWDVGRPHELTGLSVNCRSERAHGVFYARDGAHAGLLAVNRGPAGAWAQVAHFVYP